MERLPHILESQQFTLEWLEEDFFPLARKMRRMVARGPGLRYFFTRRALTGKRIVNFFYQPSTRTRLSFEFAADRLNASRFATDNAGEFSSVAKGEIIEDTASSF